MFTVNLGGNDGVFDRACRQLGEVIAGAREALAMTHEDVARIAHVSPLTVRRVEAGELGPFSIGSIVRIGEAVDVVVDFDLVPRYEELLVLAATTDRLVRVLAPVTPPDWIGGGDMGS